jgi:ABC-type sugar transport system ATPase subunit
MKQPLLSLQHITKYYPGVIALDDVSIELYEGEILALVGENGAGKSTINKILSGAIVPDAGEIRIGETVYKEMSPSLSKSLGIEVIYQEFNLFPTMTVAENVFMGNFSGNGMIVDFRDIEQKTIDLFSILKLQINPKMLVKDLTVAYMQIVEIVKAISKNVKILIMDEPTAPLSTNEVEILFDMMNRLKEKGVSIIFISHRLNEIFRIADRITVMRDGNIVETKMTGEISRDGMIRAMVGRDIRETYPECNVTTGDIVLKVENLAGNGLHDINFEVYRGEIFGISGLVGAGRTEMVRMIFGADPAEGGKIFLEGEEIEIKTPRKAVEYGIALIPEDRKSQGVILNLPIQENVSLPVLHRLSRFSFLNKIKEADLVQKQKDTLDIKTPSLRQLVKNLSGGNQQKIVLAKWLASKSKILIFDEPTRGIDVGAKQEIYQLMKILTEKGISIIMISSEMEEVVGMSHRILVLCEGRQIGILKREDFTQERILAMASGHGLQEG